MMIGMTNQGDVNVIVDFITKKVARLMKFQLTLIFCLLFVTSLSAYQIDDHGSAIITNDENLLVKEPGGWEDEWNVANLARNILNVYQKCA